MNVYTIKTISQSEVYKCALQYSLIFPSLMLFIVKDNHLSINKEIHSILSPNIVKVMRTIKWPGTISREQKSLHYCEIDKNLVNSLSKLCSDIPLWRNPEFPEDLSLIRQDNRAPWFISISHEKDCYFKFTVKEKEPFQRSIFKGELQLEGEDQSPDERY